MKARIVMTMRSTRLMSAAMAICGAAAGTALADNENYHWKANTNGNWSANGSWNEGKAPKDSDNVAIGQKAVTATLDANARLRKLTLSSPGPVTLVNGNDTGANRAKLIVPAEKNMIVLTAGQVNYGWLYLDDGWWTGPLNNTEQGLITLRGDGDINSDGTFAQHGQFHIEGAANKDARFRHRGSFTNWGTMTLNSPGADAKAEVSVGTTSDGFGSESYNTFTNVGTFSSEKGGLNNPNGSKRTIFGSVENKGTMNITTPTTFDAAPIGLMTRGGSFENTGTLNISVASLVMRGDSFTNFRGATKGTVAGKGTINVKGLAERKFKNIGGNIAPKQVVGAQLRTSGLVATQSTDVAVLEISGDYEQLQAGELSIEVDASTPLISHGQLRVTGDSALGIAGDAFLDADSLVNVSLVNGGDFLTVGQEFPILVADSLSGACPMLANSGTYGVLWSVNCDTPNTVMLRVEAVPEPATIGFALLGGLTGLVRRRRN